VPRAGNIRCLSVSSDRSRRHAAHAGTAVTIQLADTALCVIDQHGELITTVPRTGTFEMSRFTAYGTRRSSRGLARSTSFVALRTADTAH
jgi:hypothetical protein